MRSRTAMISRTVSLILATVMLVGTAFAQSPESDKAKPTQEAAKTSADDQSKSDEYVIGTDDILSICAWTESDLSRVDPAQADGMSSVALAGDVKAPG